MKGVIKKTENDEILLELNKEIYDKKAIMMSCYKFTNKCFVHFNLISEAVFNVYFKPREGQKETLDDIINEFCNELIDQQLRLNIESSYGNIRELIVQQAFSPIERIDDKIRI